jgi:1-acyl-sn-glycerol-3-phosphate acyltransferase
LKKFSFFYAFLQVLCEIDFWFYFKNRVILHGDKLVKKYPVIYCANHQNAFVDALLMALASNRQPASLVRADVFKNKLSGAFLRKVKMRPVYRMRDGFGSLGRNEHTFNECYNYLSKGGTLIVFPEGNHGELKRLRPLKKGTARIALDTLDKLERFDKLYIQPIGLDYSDHPKFRSNMLMNIGDPIEISKDRYSLKEEERTKEIQQVTKEIKESLQPLMYHQKAKDHNSTIYDFIHLVYPTRVNRKSLFLQNFFDGKEFANQFNDDLLSDDQLSRMQNLLKVGKELCYPGFFYKKGSEFWRPLMISIFTLPFYMVGALIFALPFHIIKKLQFAIKDPQFRTSVKFLTGLILYPLWLLVLASTATAFFSGKDVLIGTGLTIICGLGALNFRDNIRLVMRFGKWALTDKSQRHTYENELETFVRSLKNEA